MALQEYRKKRDFKTTAEPAGRVSQRTPTRLRFVIQEHAATRLHYDFRLELDGVLKSWAVPKGPSLDSNDKRLAVEVEDHPLEYANFEGFIPAGEYGAGEVIVWDHGSWTPLVDPRDGLKKGNLKFSLDGEKLHGDWALVRLNDRTPGAKHQWLLIKKQDEFERPRSQYDVTTALPASVKSGRKLGEFAQARIAVKPAGKNNAKSAKATTSKPRARRVKRAKRVTGRRSKMPDDVDVQLATLVDAPPQGQQWVHEVKFDGYRMLCFIQRGKAKLLTRNHLDWTHRYRLVADAAAELDVDAAILDGEVVALLPNGVSSFQSLQNAAQGSGSAKLAYYVFDLLFLNGKDLRQEPLKARKQMLADTLAGASDLLMYSEHFVTDGPSFLKQCCQLGLEGIISKRLDRPYLAGRSTDWLKCKCLGREELVIGGYTLSPAMKRGIGALLVGYFEANDFIYSGRVGTGFNAEMSLSLRKQLSQLEQDDCPFVNVPKKERAKNVRWVRPQLVAEVEFTGWTDAAVLRHPSFQGLREDKPPAAITRPASLQEDLVMPVKARSHAVPPAATDPPMKRKSTNANPSRKKPPITKIPESLNVTLTNPDRILFKNMGLTKLELATYYAQVGPWMLPYVLHRPLSLVRCPEGQSKKCFYQKHASPGTPDVLGRILVQEKTEIDEYLVIENLEGLTALAQMSILEIHTWGSRKDQVEKPDYLVFDLDPDPSVPWRRVIDGAFTVRQLLTDLGLRSFVKTTGGKGLHIVMPLKPRRAAWPAAKDFARSIAEQLVADAPQYYTAKMAKSQRKGKIFVDYLRNDHGATAIAPFSTRASPGATVAVPLAWDELSPTLKSDHFNVRNVIRRLESLTEDPWADFFQTQQTLPKRK